MERPISGYQPTHGDRPMPKFDKMARPTKTPKKQTQTDPDEVMTALIAHPGWIRFLQIVAETSAEAHMSLLVGGPADERIRGGLMAWVKVLSRVYKQTQSELPPHLNAILKGDFGYGE